MSQQAYIRGSNFGDTRTHCRARKEGRASQDLCKARQDEGFAYLNVVGVFDARGFVESSVRVTF
jgi:hypothetical protein